jgi:hypothetical protein
MIKYASTNVLALYGALMSILSISASHILVGKFFETSFLLWHLLDQQSLSRHFLIQQFKHQQHQNDF